MQYVSLAIKPKLTFKEIQIWYAHIDREFVRFKAFEQFLSENELKRAQRFHFSKDCRRYIIRRGILRVLLGSYLSCEPSLIQFTNSKNGKPLLTHQFGGDHIGFNVSHSEEYAIFAFVQNRMIGADIEKKRHVPEMERMTQRILTEKEYEYFQTVPKCKKEDVFYKFWTYKEALVKAMGYGLSFPFNRIQLSMETEAENNISYNCTFPGVKNSWTIYSDILASQYYTCVMVENRKVNQNYFPQCTTYSVNELLRV